MRISDWSSDVCSSDLQYVAALLGHRARNTDGESGAGERVPSDKGFRKAEFPAKLANLVLEQFAQRLHQRHLHPLRQAADIVMALDRHRRAAGEAHAFDNIRIERALSEEIGPADPARFLRSEEHTSE